MENNMYNAPLDMAGRNSTVREEITQHLAPKPLIHCYSFDLNNQSHIINGIPVLAGEQCEPTSDVNVDGCFINPASIADSNSFATPQGKTIAGIASNPINNNAFQEHLAGAKPLPLASALLADRIDLRESLENSADYPHSMCSLEALGPYIFNNWQETSNPLPSNFCDHACIELSSISKWNVNKILKGPEADGTEIMAYSSIGNLIQNGWTSSNAANLTDFAHNSSNCSNDLSLSLARSPTGQCSEMSCSDMSRSMNGTRTGLEQPSCSNKELSMSLGSNKHGQFSPEILGSRYLAGIQEILTQIATYSFENVGQINYSAAGVREGGNNSASALISPKKRVAMNQNANSMFEPHVEESSLERHATESNKSQLLMLLQMVDDRYSLCLDEIHTVVSAFHAATELHPHMHSRFVLQSISHLYKDLRERISNYILSMGPEFKSLCSEEKEWCVETSFIQKQLALQQLKRKHQLWRPQRGLPERSVSVLRAWMFQNFLHPYPKDAEKHLLAVKSGLSRSQVSNWFINARVRLWKPMIEEMYAELNRRKACRNEEGIESTHISRISMNNQMLNIN